MKKSLLFTLIACILVLALLPVSAREMPDVRVKIKFDNRGDLNQLRQLRIDADYQRDGWLIAELTHSELKTVRSNGFTVEIIEPDLASERALYKARGENRAYHTYDSLRAEMLALETQYPDKAQFLVTGQSVQGRDIMSMKISDNVTVDENEPEFRYEGNIHGDEKIAMELTIYLINELLANYGTDPQITNIVDNTEIFFTPTVNPDGMTMAQRYNANGVDCNRDYGYMWDGWGSSTAPWSQPETQAMLEIMMNNQFVMGMSGHAGIELFLYSWCYSYNQCWDHAEHDSVQNAYSALSNYTGGQCSSELYTVNGGSLDCDYGMIGAMGLCIEISDQKTPPVSEIDTYCLRNRAASLDMFERASNGIKGIVTDSQTGEPIPGLVEIVEIGWPVYCDPVVGDYHRYALPGTYTLRVWANDYQTVEIPNVVVPASGAVTVDVALDRGIDGYAYKFIYCRDNQSNDNNNTQTASALGPVDGEYYSICVDGYACIDMGETTPIIDYSGPDFTVWEGDDGSDESYTIAVSNSWQGPWQTIGTGTGTTEFDLDGTGLETARFVKITDDGDGSVGGVDPGFDLDAITALHLVPGCGEMQIDRGRYSCDDIVSIELIDADLNLDPGTVDTVSLQVISTSDPTGETVILTESGPDTSEFGGNVDVQEGSGGSGFVGVAHGDTLTVTYQDADCEGQPETVVETAEIDCIGPTITNVQITAVTDNSAIITWDTNEASDSVVTIGETTPPTTVVSEEMLVMSHSVLIQELSSCTDYVFSISSTDMAGNETEDNNGGSYFSFLTWELVVYIDENMDTDPGWTYEGLWEWGVPQGYEGDPSSGYTGNNVVGYNLAGDYTNGMSNTYCTTNSFDCSETTQVTFSFYKWLGMESSTYDHAAIEVSGNGGSSWTVIWEHSGPSGTSPDWEYEEYDLTSELAGQSDCLIRWNMGPTDSSVTYCGWNIDDVLVSFTQPCEEQCVNNGDVNQSGDITAGDAQLTFQIALGQYSPTPEEACCADCNGDESVTAGDAQAVFMAALGTGSCADPV